MKSVINDYICHEIVQDPVLLPPSSEASPLEVGILDSRSHLGLAEFPEEHFKITAGDSDLLPENLDNVNIICAYLRAREPGRQRAAHV
jgi:hypothetical protein